MSCAGDGARETFLHAPHVIASDSRISDGYFIRVVFVQPEGKTVDVVLPPVEVGEAVPDDEDVQLCGQFHLFRDGVGFVIFRRIFHVDVGGGMDSFCGGGEFDDAFPLFFRLNRDRAVRIGNDTLFRYAFIVLPADCNFLRREGGLERDGCNPICGLDDLHRCFRRDGRAFFGYGFHFVPFRDQFTLAVDLQIRQNLAAAGGNDKFEIECLERIR